MYIKKKSLSDPLSRRGRAILERDYLPIKGAYGSEFVRTLPY
jgi:hypothetical protein